ncbi:MAG: hypothetical protein GDA56_28600 [Hormoscilla sp. GM7CHS1pb]|nr:hypothetical protein [Hormoscilla sp. GM7CHS1pb]
MDELMPIFKELTKQPIAFLGGFCSGILGLSLYEDPLKSWLALQVGPESDASSAKAGNSTGPSCPETPTRVGALGHDQPISIE